jgi:two-component system, cell cycle sensor histidine kinase PleC
LRTPLNAIIGFSDMIASGTVKSQEKTVQYAGYVQEAAEHLLALINGILDVSKIQAGKLSVDRESVELMPIVDACLLITEAKAKEKNITVERRIAADIPNLYADPLRVKQIFINLLSNAVKFTPDWGKIQISAELAHEGYLSIIVADNGPGMTPDEIETALSPFGQLETGFNRRNEGTGLGLPIAQALCRLHEGELQVFSEKGNGTKICVHLPISTEQSTRSIN